MSASLRARLLLQEADALGVGLHDLIAASAHRPPPPTVSVFIDTLAPTFSTATAATYRSYWRLAAAHLGDRTLSSLTIEDLASVVDLAVTRARHTRPASTGRASQETCVAALRALFARAVATGLVSTNPAAALTKPRRARSRPRALDDPELTDPLNAVRTTSRDPILDLLVLRFHLESGARRQGAISLRRRDLDRRRSTAWLREKGDNEREQPVSPSLLATLDRHAQDRGAVGPDAPVFRLADGRPMTARRYDTIFTNARAALSWADRTPVSAHVLRHTAITAIGRIAGYPVAQAFAGHTAPTVTGRYLHASLAQVAAAVAILTGEPHPLAEPERRAGRSAPCQRR